MSTYVIPATPLDATVTFYRCRSATVAQRFLTIYLTVGPNDDTSKKLIETFDSWRAGLASLAGKPIDNHTVYGVECPDGVKFYVLFSDNIIAFGLSLVEEGWDKSPAAPR